MTVPRVLRTTPDGGLYQTPDRRLDRLRRDHDAIPAREVSPGESVRPSIQGDQLDIEARLQLDAGTRCALTVRETPDGAESTIMILDRQRQELRLERERSSRNPAVDTEPLSGPLPLDETGTIDLRVLLDRSALEIFANGRALAARIYPTHPDAAGIRLESIDGRTRIERFDTWTMADIRRHHSAHTDA